MATDDPSLPVAIALVALGGAAGATTRHLVGLALPGRAGTLVVNVVGATLLGLVLYRALATGGIGPRAELLAATGYLSSLTTYSTFALEAVQAGVWPGSRYVLLTYGLGIAGVLLGRAVALRRWGRPGAAGSLAVGPGGSGNGGEQG